MEKETRRKNDPPNVDRQPSEEYRARLAAIIDSSDDAIASKTLAGIVTSWNKAAERIFGYTAEEAIGKSITMIIPKEHLSEEDHVLARIIRGETVDHFETVRVRKDGTLVEISLTVSPIRDQTGRVIGASKIARDISEQKQKERELKLLYVEAEQANRAKDEFLAMLGHELRNPLGAISNALSLLDDGNRANAVAAQLARDVLRRQVGSLSRLIDDLLDIGRLVTGKILLRKVPLDLSQVVSRTAAGIRASGRFERHDVSLQLEPAWIEADDVRIEQIVTNLVGNALKYTPAGGSIRISVGLERGAGVFRVEDTGIGIPEDLLPRVFDLFVQGARSLDRTEGGMGVGLSVVRRLSELHGGSVTAFSMGSDHGSRFTMRIPAISAPSLRRHEGRDNPTAMKLASRRILIVEDNRDARETLQMLLLAKGHEVYSVANGKDALDYASRVPSEVAIIDLGLPEMDGYEVARKLRETEGCSDTLLVALTGYGAPEDRKLSEKAGFHAHLLKPLDYEKLTSLLQKNGT